MPPTPNACLTTPRSINLCGLEREPDWIREGREQAREVERRATALAETLIGLSEAEASADAIEGGCTARIVARDDQQYAVRADRRFNRINLTVVAGTVTKAEVY